MEDEYGNTELGEVIIINPENERLSMLPTIEAGKKITQNMIDEQNHKDLLSLDAMKEYFKRYLESLGDAIDFQVNDAGIQVSLIEMLSKRIDVKRSESERTFKCMPTLKQSFMTAGKSSKLLMRLHSLF